MEDQTLTNGAASRAEPPSDKTNNTSTADNTGANDSPRVNALTTAAQVLNKIPSPINKDLDDNMANALRIYDRMAGQLMTGLVILGVIAVGCSLFVTAFAGSSWFDTNAVKVTSFASSLSLTLITAFSLATKGNSVRTAWRHLNKARLLYTTGHSSDEEYIKAYGEAETMLGGVEFSSPTAPKPQRSQDT